MAQTFFQGLLGEKLSGKSGDVQTASICGEGKTVGLYFSAHWCPPCRGFTPKLAEFYKNHHQDKNFEIVFVSSDKNETEFSEYYKDMPWLALPYADRTKKDHLSQKFKVSGIPTLVFLDGKDGKEITKEGRGMLLDDPKGDNFPWKPKGVREILKEVKLINNKKEEKSFDDLSGKVIGLYFSAHWCPPCKSFTPKLIACYNKILAKGKSFEIIFVSSDRGEEGFNDYFKDMPWLAVPFGHDVCKQLSTKFSVQGIPTFILMDDKQDVISMNGRGCVSNDPEGEDFPWKLKPLNVLNEMTVNTINEEPCLIYFTDGEDASIKRAQEIIQPIAESLLQKEDSPVIFFYTKGDETSESLLDFLGIDDDDDDNQLVIVDIPSQKLYVSDDEVLTKEGVAKFVTEFAGGKLSGKKLRG